MKKILLSCTLIALVSMHAKLDAQSCAVSAPIISNISTSTGAGGCTITFDLRFDFTGNNGNKWKAVYIWTEADYNALPSNFYGANGLKVPTTADLNASNALGAIAICTDSSTVFSLYRYPGNSTNPTAFKPHLAFSSSGNTLVITGLSVTVPDCSVPVKLKADVGAANAQSFTQFGCLAHGLSFTANDPILTGLLGCGNPRYFQFSAKALENTNLTFSAYQDIAPAGYGPEDVLLQAPAGFVYSGNGVSSPTPISTYDNISLATVANTTIAYGQFPFQSSGGSKFDVIIKLQLAVNNNLNTLLITNTCSALPVKLTYFNAKRTTSSNVNLTWQTAQEINARGFEIQRLIGTGGWQVVGFVASQALYGNSSSPLNYSFNDANSAHAITQYRLREVDIDANSKFSEIRAVRGDGQAGKIIVYPNPSFDGTAKIVFEEINGTRDVSLNDASGRVIKQWKGVTNNNLEIDNLTPGFYSLRVIIRETGEQSIEKIVVNKR